MPRRWNQSRRSVHEFLAGTKCCVVGGAGGGPLIRAPYHDEHFPGEQCAYEEHLLQGHFFAEEDKRLRGEAEELPVELYLLQE